MAADDTQPSPSRRRRLRALAFGLLGLVALLLVLAGVGGTWLWHSEAGLERALRQVPGLTLDGVHGRPTGGRYEIGHLQWRSDTITVQVDGLSWREAHWRWRPHAGAWIGLALDEARAASVRVTTKPSPASEPATPPKSLRLPLEFIAPGLRVDSLQLSAQPALTGLVADVHLGADHGATHRIDHLRLARAPFALAGSLRIGSGDGLPLDARLGVATPTGQPSSWRASLRAAGPLQRLALAAGLRTEAGAGLDAEATVAPFAPWPVLALNAALNDLDLAALQPGLPQTRLAGHVQLAEPQSGQPLALDMALTNATPGRWDAGRLPLRRIDGRVRGRPDAPDRLDVDHLALEFGGERPAGQLLGSGGWQGRDLTLQARLVQLQPAQLDSRLAPARIDGPIDLALHGPALPGAPAAPPGLNATLKADLHGQLADRRAPPLHLQAEAAVSQPADGTLKATLKTARAEAGSARAEATAEASRDAAGAWSLRSTGALSRFDIATWWPGNQHRSDLNGRWQADLQLPPPAADPAKAPPLLAALRGNASLALAPSRLSGVPLSGDARLKATADALQVQAQLQAAANTLQLNGQRPPDATRQHWQGTVDAPALAALGPLFDWVPGAAAWRPQAGSAHGRFSLDGEWPGLQTDGDLTLAGLQLPTLQLGSGRLRWTLSGTTPDAPLRLEADLANAAQGQRRLEALHALLSGSLRSHTLNLQASSPVRPPAWTEAVAGATPPGGSRLQLALHGGWTPASAGGGTWRGTLAELRGEPRNDGTPWLQAENIGAAVRLDGRNQPQDASLAPGRLALFGGALAWQQAQWQAPPQPGGLPRVRLDATLEPLKVARLLASLQPQFGWRGDLAIAGRARLRSDARIEADVVLQRQAGDLGLTVSGVAHELGLTELRAGLTVQNGRWQATQALAGRNLGVLGGQQTLLAPADALVPPPASALQGNVDLRLVELASLSAWLPPGWRLGGALEARATLGGRLDAPTVQGQLSGRQLAVRNLFEGIHLRNGTLQARLDGDGARIETLTFEDAASGRLRADGSARFGEQPQARLHLVAEHLRVLDRVDRRVAISGEATAGLADKRLSANGRFTVDEGLIDITSADAPTLSKDIVVYNRPGVPEPKPMSTAARPPEGGARVPLGVTLEAEGAPISPRPTDSGLLAGAQVDLRIDLGRQLQLKGRGLDTRLAGQLAIGTTPAGALAVNGTVRTVEGTYTAYGQNLAIDRGVIVFSGDAANPRLDIVAIRPDVDIRVGVIVSGNAVDPRVRLYSEPEMPEFDKLTWMMTGHAPEGLGSDETALLQRAAMALLAGDRSGNNNGFLKKLGIDQFSVSGLTSGDATQTVVSLGKQISKRLYVGYAQALAATGGTWQLMYRVAGRTTVRASAGIDNALDVIWTWRWN
jgi:translocation and assembly module TamB